MHNFNKNISLRKLVKLSYLFFTIITIFFIFRVGFLLFFTQGQLLQEDMSTIVKYFFAAFKFDCMIATYVLIPLFLLAVIFVFTKPKKPFLKKIYLVFFKYYSWIILTILSTVYLIDYYFFKTYSSHFNSMIFGLKDDDTSALLISIWKEFPVIKVLLIIGLISILSFYLIKKILKSKPKFHLQNPIAKILFFLLVFGFYFSGMRGSLSLFPLNKSNATITENTLLNEIAINPFYALKETLTDESHNYNFDLNPEKIIQENGFKSIDEALSLYLNSKINDTLTPYTSTIQNAFLEQNKPNVIFILMESLSKHIMEMHSKNLNTLGELENVLDQCYVFKNTLSGDNLTVFSLEKILISSPFQNISQSKYLNFNYKNSIAIPFIENKYETSFVYGGEYEWRNVGTFMKNQGFKNIISRVNLEKKYPNAEGFAWGIHDEYLYDAIFEQLKNAKKPQFIFGLTISNHTPYDLPKDFSPQTIKIPAEFYSRIKKPNAETDASFKSYQYAANALGVFLKKILNSKLKDNTIIAITGDHNIHYGYNYNEEESFLERSVPILFYIPEKYKAALQYNTSKFGSHKDIFPTLYQIALSKTKYYKTGNSLFDNKYNYAVNNFNLAVDSIGAIKIVDNQVNFYLWKDKTYKNLVRTKTNAHLDTLLLQLKASKTVHSYFIQKDLQNNF